MDVNKKRKVMTKVLSNFNHNLDPEQLSKGIDVEKEHTGYISKSTNITKGDKTMQTKIAVAHLKEDPKYYTHLEKMEDSVKKDKKYGEK